MKLCFSMNGGLVASICRGGAHNAPLLPHCTERVWAVHCPLWAGFQAFHLPPPYIFIYRVLGFLVRFHLIEPLLRHVFVYDSKLLFVNMIKIYIRYILTCKQKII